MNQSPRKAANYQNSLRSGWRMKPGTRDGGERFKVLYRDGNNVLRAYGFTDDEKTAANWVVAIGKTRAWHSAKVVDRRKVAA